MSPRPRRHDHKQHQQSSEQPHEDTSITSNEAEDYEELSMNGTIDTMMSDSFVSLDDKNFETFNSDGYKRRGHKSQSRRHRSSRSSGPFACGEDIISLTDVIFETLGDTGDAITLFLKRAKVTGGVNATKEQFTEVMKRNSRKRAEGQRLKKEREEEERKARYERRIDREITIARAECSGVADLWRQEK